MLFNESLVGLACRGINTPLHCSKTSCLQGLAGCKTLQDSRIETMQGGANLVLR